MGNSGLVSKEKNLIEDRDNTDSLGQSFWDLY